MESYAEEIGELFGPGAMVIEFEVGTREKFAACLSALRNSAVTWLWRSLKSTCFRRAANWLWIFLR